jgi:SAM-dependent methyltransferase
VLPPYRIVRAAANEGPEFLATLDRVARFYTTVMRGRTRREGPEVRLKWSRDWEYPWVLTRAGVGAGVRVVDCGAGNSPLPFLMAEDGGRVTAVDRDAIVVTRVRYARQVAADWITALWGLPGDLFRSIPVADTDARSPARTARRSSSMTRKRSWPIRAWRFLHVRLVARHRAAFARILKPDFWGPVSPALLDRFGVEYVRADLAVLPFRPASFDVVTCVSVLEHMPRHTRAQAVREMARILEPGGRLILTYDRHDEDLTDDLVAASGCEPVELACLQAPSAAHGSRQRPDAIGISLVKPAPAAGTDA